MIDFSQRSYKKELLDQENIPFEAIQQNMAELNFINTHLGGHGITISGMEALAGNRKNISVCEIGCGGGDNLNALYKWCNKHYIAARFTGIDINPDCLAYARSNSLSKDFTFIASDYRQVTFGPEKPDIIFCSLFCHHFTGEQLLDVLSWMKVNSNIGFFINDLHRHPLAYYFIKYATRLFSKSYLVKNDAPLSVLRGFTRKEWVNLLQRSDMKNYTITWKWAFRYLIIVRNG